jgi:glutathione S-transferase
LIQDLLASNDACFYEQIAGQPSRTAFFMSLIPQTKPMILHHYPNSPFAEKIRALLGFKGVAWQSVAQPDIMPKADLQALTGGYRRIPVLQIGADVYCDTSLIVQVIERMYPTPSMYGTGNAGAIDTIAQWADDTLFWAAMGYNFKGAAALFANRTPEAAAQAAKAFAEDRSAMFGGVARQRPNDATGAYKLYLQRISSMLGTHDFLFGAVPTLADFACYHPLWFTATRVPQMAVIFDATPNLRAWLARMQAFSQAGKALCSDLSAPQALAMAARSAPAAVDPAFVDEHGIELGAAVAITAEKFGLEASVGVLVAATPQRYTIARTDPRAGTVHVHFPRLGFSLKRIEPVV